MEYILTLKVWQFNALVGDMNAEVQESNSRNTRTGRPAGSTPVIS